MSNAELQEKIKRDLEKLPMLDVEILDGKILYGEALGYAKASYIRFLMSVVMLIIPSLLIHGDILRIYKFIGPFIVFALFMLVMHGIAFSRVTMYIILRDTIFPKLESGQFLQQKILWLWHIARRCFFYLWSALFLVGLVLGWRSDPRPTDFLGGYVIIGAITWIVMHIILSNEMNRLGISGLFSLINTIANRGKKEPSHSEENDWPTKGQNSALYDPSDMMDYRNPHSPFNPNNPINSSPTDHK